MGHNRIDVSGQRFGKWAIGERAGSDKAGAALYEATCDCGAKALVRGSILHRGLSTGCRVCVSVTAMTVAKTKAVVGYMAAHDRVRAARGKVSRYRCVDCGGPAKDWSYDGGDPDERHELVHGRSNLAYSLDVNRYSPRCRSDHRKHDAALRKATQ